MDVFRNKINELLSETDNCPFLLSKKLGVKRWYTDYALGELAGMYIEPIHGVSLMYINSSYDPETQEDACFNLILHHLTHPGITMTLTKDDLIHAKKLPVRTRYIAMIQQKLSSTINSIKQSI